MASSESEASDLELYCSSGSVTDYDSNDDNDSDTGALPYQFEPVLRLQDVENNRDLDPEDPDNNDDRTQHLDWCQCGHCAQMPTVTECKCCMEIAVIQQKLEEYRQETGAEIQCLTDHPGFRTVCLDRYVLETAYYQYRQQYGDFKAASINEQRRYVAYRQLARWCWGYLGKEVRVVLPACAVTQIRDCYPSQEYKGYQETLFS